MPEFFIRQNLHAMDRGSSCDGMRSQRGAERRCDPIASSTRLLSRWRTHSHHHPGKGKDPIMAASLPLMVRYWQAYYGSGRPLLTDVGSASGMAMGGRI